MGGEGQRPYGPGVSRTCLVAPMGLGLDFALRAACFISKEFDLIGFYSVCSTCVSNLLCLLEIDKHDSTQCVQEDQTEGQK